MINFGSVTARQTTDGEGWPGWTTENERCRKCLSALLRPNVKTIGLRGPNFIECGETMQVG